MTTLGERLSQARRELGVRERRDVTKGELAKAAGVDDSTVSLWEQDKKAPREAALAKLAKHLGVTPAYLRYGVLETRPPVQAGPDEPSEKDRAEWLNGEMEAARIEREQADAASTAAGSKSGRTRRR